MPPTDTNRDNRIDAMLPDGHTHTDDDQDAGKGWCSYLPRSRDGSQQKTKITWN